ncbi:ATP-grasp domain-containing protein [Virgibacillus sp. YIM 98842]|uniref:ATP-grasp domain-containing protein n=1 Tax=Virgibacillus sp. YIM 98842 TaxID=2663533 RepID=UPI0013D92314|nr:ATP-grasp domain-containing protein [Virgibacillus sp. YIM 98842]
MYSGWLIYEKKDAVNNQSFIEWFIEEAHLQNMALTLILREEIMIGIKQNSPVIFINRKEAGLPDAAIVRTMDPFLSSHLEACGVSVFNSSHVSRICNNKALTHQYISELSIPMVDMVFSNREQIQEKQPFDYPFIIKEMSGKGGTGVYYIENRKDLQACMVKISHPEIIIQRCNVQLGKDVRVFVVGKEIVGAVLRGNKHDFRANFKLGGNASLYHLNDRERDMVKQIMNIFDFGLAGIDFLIGYNGELIFNEIEDVVGSRTLSAVSNINILNKYMHYITANLKSRDFKN